MNPRDAAEQRKETNRLEAFSDGVFAIAITLLILDLKVPHDLPPGTSLLRALARQWPSYLAFLGSFATIGIMWINHHRLFGMIARVDQGLLVLNGLLLLCVTVVPFPTALVAAWARSPECRTAAMAYTGTFVVTAVCYNLLWWHAHRWGRLLGGHVSAREVRATTVAYSFGVPVYSLSFMAAMVNFKAALTVTILLALFFAIPAELMFPERK